MPRDNICEIVDSILIYYEYWTRHTQDNIPHPLIFSESKLKVNRTPITKGKEFSISPKVKFNTLLIQCIGNGRVSFSSDSYKVELGGSVYDYGFDLIKISVSDRRSLMHDPFNAFNYYTNFFFVKKFKTHWKIIGQYSPNLFS